MTAVFISYSSRDRSDIDPLLSALRRADEDVWFDEELGGGDVWWQQILQRIRDCEVFLYALSDNSLESKPCLTELNYAQALRKPVLPVQIGPVQSIRVTPVAAVEAVDFRTPTADSGIRLITALTRAKQRSNPLPDPLPEEPPVPFAYLMRVASVVSGTVLEPRQQAEIVEELTAAIAQEGADSATHRDIAQLLHTLRGRTDLTDQTRADIDSLLAGFAEQPRSAGARRSGRWIAAALAALTITAAGIGVAVFTTTKKPQPAASSTSSTIVPSPTVSREEVDALLLSAAELATVTGVPGIQPDGDVGNYMFVPEGQLSDPDCLGADYAAAQPVYEGSGWSAVSVQTLTETPPADPSGMPLWADQAAVSFPTVAQARDFVERSADHWAGCTGKVLKDTISPEPQEWTFGALIRDSGTISQISFEEGAHGFACQHTMTSYSNAVLEAVVCSPHLKDDARRVVERMAEKAKTTG